MGSSRALQEAANMDDGDDDQDEDEETLQLKLQAIQAKLKLKKLQNAKKTADEGIGSGRSSRQEKASSPRKAEKQPVSPTRLYRAAVDVPVSPVRNARAPQEHLSPARQRLGLTSVPKAGDVSLKRARDGSQLRKAKSQPSLRQEDLPKPKSFSERLAQTKHDEEEKQAKKDKLERMRSSGFNHTRSETPSRATQQPTPSGRASKLANVSSTRPSSAGQEADSSVTQRISGLSRSASARESRDTDRSRSKGGVNPGAYGHHSGTGHAYDESDTSLHIGDVDDDSGYDPFSKIHLKTRHISHSAIAREMEGKEVYNLPRLLKEVKAPHYDAPDCESDYVVFAVLASKSNPLDHAQSHKTTDQVKDDYEAPRNKFMVLHLCDLKWEVDCFLFGTAFNQFWKLTPGTLLAILNPAILPPKGNQNNGRFSLKLGSSEDAVMEVGIARDLGYCSAIKKDGQPCGEWIDKRKTEACEFHINLQIEKSRKGRMEVNTMARDFGKLDDGVKSKAARENRDKNQIGGKYHREYGQLYSVPGGGGKGVASLLDAEDTDALHNMTTAEASRKRIANAQKERDLAKQLGEMGRGVGAEYMRAKHRHTTSTTTISSTVSSTKDSATDDARNALFAKPKAAEQGLLGKKSGDVQLSPAKDRKKHFGLGSMSIFNGRSAEPMGWGGARKAGLLQPKENRLGSPERGQTKISAESIPRPNLVRPRSQQSSLRSNGSSSPTKKKARFNLERGIREPGRDSLPGNAAAGAALDDDDDDDDLDIV
ncbi:DNA replication licensing factor mcm10 [Lecanosticta acicola]|uniref:DNA replication licensing factor mcm10 n=1 Tax=Lecanosticta acicola TaxID=111012 RepID=A0AAI8YVI4_9PEZI|nr:DNA replication licensing factor mcm10 [Lecanosticta acicola]